MKWIAILLVYVSLTTSSPHHLEQEKSAVNVTLHDNKNSQRYEISSEQDTAAFSDAVKGAVKMNGIVNIASPQYEFTLNKETYSLWISPETGTTAALMNENDTHSVYTVDERLTEKLMAAVQHASR